MHSSPASKYNLTDGLFLIKRKYIYIYFFTIFSDSLSDLLFELVMLLYELQVPQLIDKVTLLTHQQVFLVYQAEPLLH